MRYTIVVVCIVIVAQICIAQPVAVKCSKSGHTVETMVDKSSKRVRLSSSDSYLIMCIEPGIKQIPGRPYSNILTEIMLTIYDSNGMSPEAVNKQETAFYHSKNFSRVSARKVNNNDLVWIIEDGIAPGFVHSKVIHLMHLEGAYIKISATRENCMSIPSDVKADTYTLLGHFLHNLTIDGQKYNLEEMENLISYYKGDGLVQQEGGKQKGTSYNRAEVTRIYERGMTLLKEKRYDEGRDAILKSVKMAADAADYGTAYWGLWQLAVMKTKAWPISQSLEWYEDVVAYIKKRDRNNYKWASIDLPNLLQVLCEKETRHHVAGTVGKAYMVYLEAEEMLADLLRLRPDLKTNANDNDKAIYANVLLDRAKHQEVSGKLMEAEKTYLEVAEIASKLTEHETLCRVFNNHSVVLEFMGRDLEGDAMAEKARNLKNAGSSVLLAEVNELRSRSQDQGPSEEIADQLRVKISQLNKARRYNDALATQRRLATVLSNLGRTEEAMQEFDSVIKTAEKSEQARVLADSYLWRAKARVSTDLEAAEDDILRALEFYRKESDKPKEYIAYKCYARILHARGENDDALFIIDETLRLVNMMEAYWVKPQVLVIKAEILFDLGLIKQADVTFLDAIRLMEELPGFTPRRKLDVLSCRLVFLARLNRTADMASLVKEIDQFIAVAELSDYSINRYREIDTSKIDRVHPARTEKMQSILMAPFYCSTRVAPGDNASTMLWLMNPNNVEEFGRLTIGTLKTVTYNNNDPLLVSIDIGDRVSSGASSPDHSMTLPSESIVALKITHHDPPALKPDNIAIKWKGSTLQETRWDVIIDADDNQLRAKVNASLLLKNSFYNVPVYHAVSGGTASDGTLADFKVEGSIPCRLELYDAATAELLGIDSDGNGSFLDKGDVLAQDSDMSGYPDAPNEDRHVICYIYPLKDQKAVDYIDISFSISHDGEWKVIGTDRLIIKK